MDFHIVHEVLLLTRIIHMMFRYYCDNEFLNYQNIIIIIIKNMTLIINKL